jgi:phosphoribosylanthranilate isomerase
MTDRRPPLAITTRWVDGGGMGATAKICGVSTPDALDAAVGGGASHVGFVFFPPSPRNVSPEQAAGLAQRVPEHVAKVGVFVDPDDTLIDRAIAAGVDALQLHKTSPARAAAIRQRTGRELWAAVAIKTRGDLDAARGFAGAADRILYDAKTPEGSAIPGGMGLRFDWRLLDGVRHPLPWALSGGLDAGNVAEAIGRTGARLVDVSSGVESAPGIKDAAKIAAFLAAVDSL